MDTIYVNNNGKVLENLGLTIETGNRGYLYGDGLFETIRVMNGLPLSLDAHIMRLKEGMAALQMHIPTFYSVDFFEEKILELLLKSGIENGGKVRLSVDRLTGGTYLPETNEVSYFIEVYPLKNNDFELNVRGNDIELFAKMTKQQNVLSNFKTKNSIINVMAALEARNKELDDLLLLNDKGNIIEGTSSNLFLVSNGILYTPGLDEGCVGGIMRMTIINLALENNIKVYESPITPGNLLGADEVFLTNTIGGVIWCSSFRSKQYKNTVSCQLVHLLNQFNNKGKAVC